MIIVWRGWGGLGAAFIFLGAMCGAIASSVTDDDSILMLCFGLGLAAFGIVGWLAGVHLNVTRPTREIEQHLVAVRQELLSPPQLFP